MTTHAPTLAINALEEELSEAAEYCREHGIGLEITAFAYPENLDGGGFDDRVRRHVDELAGIQPVFLHGPFLDLYVTSADPRIRAVAGERHDRALEAAAALGAGVYIAHLNSLPLIRNRDYRRRFTEGAVDFWAPLADRAGRSGTTIVLENMWEDDPALQKSVITEAAHPYLRASFDNGHALVFSDRPASEWIRVLGDDLSHVHLHDNDGTYDEHRPVGEGSEDWSALIAAWRAHAPAAPLVLETDRLASNCKSLEAFRKMLKDGELPG